MSDYQLPEDCRYTREDEWVRVEGDACRVGVTDYAQQQLGDVVFVEVPEVGASLEKGATFGVIESVKAVSDLFAPVSGQVTGVNEALADAPEQVNSDCYGEGWILTIEGVPADQLDGLMDAAAYRAYIAERES